MERYGKNNMSTDAGNKSDLKKLFKTRGSIKN